MVSLRAFALWLILIVVEAIHGIFRRLVLEPMIGDFPARQVSVFTGSVLILIVTYLFIDRIGARTVQQLTFVGLIWVLLTVLFEIGIGRFVLDYSWSRVLSDFNLVRGGLLPLGLLVMGFAPRVASTLDARQRALPNKRKNTPQKGT